MKCFLGQNCINISSIKHILQKHKFFMTAEFLCSWGLLKPDSQLKGSPPRSCTNFFMVRITELFRKINISVILTIKKSLQLLLWKNEAQKASFLAGAIEIALCYCWSNGILNYSSDLNWKVVVAGSLVTFWRSTHFYSMHRVMHPWRINGVPDIGRWLYRHVHSLHHKDRSRENFKSLKVHDRYDTGFWRLCYITYVYCMDIVCYKL